MSKKPSAPYQNMITNRMLGPTDQAISRFVLWEELCSVSRFPSLRRYLMQKWIMNPTIAAKKINETQKMNMNNQSTLGVKFDAASGNQYSDENQLPLAPSGRASA